MNIPAALDASSSFLVRLIDPAVRSFALACIASGALALCRAKNVALRLSVWRTILVVALAMPFLALLMPPLPVSVPFAQKFSRLQSPAITLTPAARRTGTLAAAATANSAPAPAAAIPAFNYTAAPLRNYSRPTPPAALEAAIESRRTPLSRMAIAGMIYATVTIFFLARLILGTRFGRRLDRNSHSIDDPGALARLHFFARAAHLRAAPRLAESEFLSVPVTFGIKHPSILLPATWREWEPAELDAVLVHEISHVARRDALTERLSLLHRAIFWFSPLSWWLDRRLAELAEEASDDAALGAGADRTRYAETVLGFFAVLEAAPGRVWWQGVAMASTGQAEKRVDRILEWKGSVAMQLRKPVVVGVVLLAIPLVGLTAAFRPTIADVHLAPPQSVQPAGRRSATRANVRTIRDARPTTGSHSACCSCSVGQSRAGCARFRSSGGSRRAARHRGADGPGRLGRSHRVRAPCGRARGSPSASDLRHAGDLAPSPRHGSAASAARVSILALEYFDHS